MLAFSSAAQPTWTLDPFGKEKKPKKYEEKVLGSEKTATKKFTPFRRFIQNNVTHYNYYFNANNKINEVIERAKMAQKDDYSRLLSFYPYNLENTATQQVELDSVIYKSTSGILLHDLRNDWVDNLYLLIGKSYFLRKEFDSAALTFQFINYNLFPRKKNENDSRVIGGRDVEKPGIFSIADKEDRNFVQKALTKAPSRNESLLWLARTFIEKKEFGEAAGLINILENDPNFPKRLHNDLEEIAAYWFYAQNNFDSASVHLEKALSNAANKQDRSRWEFLLGQMYEMTGSFDKASYYYAKASKHTADPILDIYARLNDAKMNRQTGNEAALRESIARLMKMAKRDKYEAYRDIIYYSAGKISVQLPDTVSGVALYRKGVNALSTTEGVKSQTYFQLGNIAYRQRDYKNAAAAYDSIRIEDTAFLDEHNFNLAERSATLKKLVTQLMIVEREDSLQMVAAMDPEAREDFVRKVMRSHSKESGAKNEDPLAGKTLITFNNAKDGPVDLFAAPDKGDWYFNNNSLKSRGFNEFKVKWGKRDNVDNWRRIEGGATLPSDKSGMVPPAVRDSLNKAQGVSDYNYSFEGMMDALPLTPQEIDSSNLIIAESIFTMGRLFQFELEDHEQAVNMFELYLQRFPTLLRNGEVYLGLYYSYNKLGNEERADHYKKLLNSDFSSSPSALALNNPAALDPERKDPAATARYASIYDLFIEGKFDEALAAKRSADSIYGSNYWTPQLLYIEAVHHIRQKNDSLAIVALNNITTLYPTSPLQPKALMLIDVLNRRPEIEAYLNNLQVTRATEDQIILPSDDKVEVNKVDAPELKPISKVVVPVMKDSGIAALPNTTDGTFTLNAAAPHFVLMVLNKVDGTYQNEAGNAFNRYNREMFYSAGLTTSREALDAENALLITGKFDDAAAALSYFDKVKKAAPREVSWLPANKYYFLIISADNLQKLRENKDLNAYRNLLKKHYENRF